MSIRRIALVLALALLASPVFAQTTIDDFTTAQPQLQAAASCPGTSCSFMAGGMLGGERDLRAHLFSGSGVAATEVTGGAFLFNGVGTAFAEARLVWDGADGNADVTAYTGLAGTNLTTGADSIILDVNSSSAGTVVIVEVFTNATSSSLYTLWLPAVAAPTSFALPFTAFTTHLGSGATFSSVGAVSLTVRGPGATLSLNAFRAGTGAAPAVTASKTVAISNDLGRAGTAEPGDTIKYTIQIENKSGKPTSPNTALADILDANLTLVPGSAEASPIGIEDHYFQGGATISIAAPGVLGNDVDPDGDAKSVAITGSITTSKGATATVNANGSFSVPISADDTLDTFTYEVTDGNGITSATVVTVGFLNQPPVVTTTGGTTAFTEDAGSVVVDSGVTVTDDGTTLASAAVTITNLLDGASEVLAALPSGSILAGDISYSSGTLTITRAGGLVSEYQTVLQSVRYNNTSNAPTTTTRSLAFAANDGFAASNTGTKNLSVAALNDTPALVTSGGTASFTEDGAAVAVDPGITVTDIDSATLSSGTIQIMTNLQTAQDVLAFTNDGSTMGNITAAYAPAAGLLSLTSSGATATVAEWQSALRAVKYSNTSQNPSTLARTVVFRVFDGAANSNPDARDVQVIGVNDAPVLTNGSTLNFTEGGAAAAINTAITVADVDNTTHATGTVSITVNFASGDDVLLFANSPAMGNIAGNYVPGTGVLTLTSAGSTATLLQWQNAFRAVQYANSSQNPTTGPRTVAFVVNDGALASNVVTSTINVTAINDAPVALAKSSTVTANMKRAINASLLVGATDADNGVNGCSTTLSVASIGSGVNGTVSNVNLAAGTFDFDPNPGFTGSATVAYTVSDDGCPGPAATSAAATITITVSGPIIWFVDNAVVGPGDGRLSNPFKTLASADAVDAAGQGIFLVNGTYATGIALNSGEVLIGQGVSTVSNAGFTSFDAVFGISPPAGTIARPGIAGTRPIVQGTVTLNATSVVRGLNISSSGSTGMNDPAGSIASVAVTEVAVTTTTGSAVALSDVTSGGLTFTALTTGGGAGVSLTGGNTGSTFSFAGVSVSSGASSAFAATGGGTVTVTGAGNTLTSTTGTALNVSNTTIGASGLTFQSISANGAANGIVLNNTGSAGGLTVTGSGTTDGTGGTIQNTTGRGASFITASNITLKNMNFTSAGTSDLDADNSGLSTGDNLLPNAAIHLQSVTTATLDNLNLTTGAEMGINGNTVSNFVLKDSVISGFGNSADEDGIHFFNMSGSSAITNTTVSSSFDDHLNLQTQAGTLDLAITGGSFNSSTQGSGLLFGIRGTTNATIDINGATTSANFSGGIVADSFDSATMNLRVNGSTSSGNNDQLSVSAGDNSLVDLEATGNTLSSVAVGDFVVVSLLGSAFDNGFVFDARIHNNSITTANGLTADGIVVFNAGGGVMNTAITNNTINYGGTQRGILLQTGQDGAGLIRATVTGNALSLSNATLVNGVLAQSAITHPSGEGASIDLNIGGVAAALKNTFTHPGGAVLAGGDIRVRQRFDGNYNLDGYGGTAFDNAAVATYLNGRNTVVSASTATSDSAGGLGGVTDDPGPGFTGAATPAFVTVAVSPASVLEDGATNLTYTLTRNGSTAGSLVANFVITGTASAPSDFIVTGATSFTPGTGVGTVTFAAGSATSVITVDPTPDSDATEFDESVILDLGNGSFARGVITDDSPLLMAQGGVESAALARGDERVPFLAKVEVDAIVSVAMARWTATGLTDEKLAALQRLTLEVGDLPSAQLARGRFGRILVDNDASGPGWFVGVGDEGDDQFALRVSATRLYADPAGAPAGRVDLLTAIMHEMGHAIGLEDTYAEADRDDVMYGYVTKGERRLPSPGQGSAVKSMPRP